MEIKQITFLSLINIRQCDFLNTKKEKKKEKKHLKERLKFAHKNE